MLSEAAKRIVERANPKEDVVLIVSVKNRPSEGEIGRIRDVASRRHYVDAFYKNAKAPVLAHVRRLGVRIVDPLEGTPQLIVAAPASIWRSAMVQPGSVFHDPQLTLAPNEPLIGLP